MTRQSKATQPKFAFRGAKTDEVRFLQAMREVRRSTPPKAGRPRANAPTLKTPTGFLKVQAYMSPLEESALRALARGEGISLSEAIRGCVRLVLAVQIDGEETS